jgi:hypothetical protein
VWSAGQEPELVWVSRRSPNRWKSVGFGAIDGERAEAPDASATPDPHTGRKRDTFNGPLHPCTVRAPINKRRCFAFFEESKIGGKVAVSERLRR